jgi:hypothetical protein
MSDTSERVLIIAVWPQPGVAEKLLRFMKEIPFVSEWWNHIPNVYCVKTHLTVLKLTNLLDELIPGSYMVAELKPETPDGRLPAKAWSWFHDKALDDETPNLPRSAIRRS